MNIERNLRCRYDDTTGVVHLTIRRTTGRGKNRRRTAMPLDRIPRANLRDLCDALHDFADELDRKDRSA